MKRVSVCWRLRVIILLCSSGLILPLIIRLLPDSGGNLVWLLDLVAHWQWLFFAGLLLSAVFAVWLDRKWSLFAVLLPLPWITASPTLPQGDKGSILTLASFNIQVGTTQVGPLANWLALEKPDVVVLLEVSPEFAMNLPALKAYPYQITHPDHSPFGLAMLSKWPINTSQVIDDENGIAHIEADVLFGQQLIAVTAFHPMPPLSPYFHTVRNQQLRGFAQKNMARDIPSVLAGDLNATPWSKAFSGLDGFGWHRATSIRPTWPAWGQGVMGIPIDHVLASRQWRLQSHAVGPYLGSDHLPVLVRLALPSQSIK